MNVVIVNNLRAEINRFNQLIDDYEENYLNLYHELSSNSIFWQDNHAFAFFEHVRMQKIKMKRLYQEFVNVRDIYQILVASYEEFGNKIQFDFDFYDNVMRKYQENILQIQNIISYYNTLDLSFCDEKNLILSQRDSFVRMKQIALESRNRTKQTVQKIIEIEQQVKRRLSDIHIEILQNTDISEFI